jgi:hypothetical protein
MREIRFPPLLWAALALPLFACELDEVSITEPENALVAEAFLKVGDGSDEISAFLHWTLGGSGASDLDDATVRLERSDGLVVSLFQTEKAECLASEVVGEVSGACFRAPPLTEGVLRPGDRVAVEITTSDGMLLQGGMVLPQDFALASPVVEGACALPPGVPLEFLWSKAEGAWVYTGEAVIWGLRDALAPEGIQLEEDSVTLQGISISETDTTMVFPQEFGVFDRFDLDRDLALALQEGLPLGAEADVVISALERNYVNWVRGGSFNPSGLVRVPSLRGDGVGVLGGVVRRIVRVVGAGPEAGIPSCVPAVLEPVG